MKTALFILGIMSLDAGCFMMYIPLGFAVLGTEFVILAWIIDRAEREKE